METRTAKVWRLFHYPLRHGGTRYEAFFTGVDGQAPVDFAATTFEPFTASLLDDARRADRELWVTVDIGSYGMDLIRAEHAA